MVVAKQNEQLVLLRVLCNMAKLGFDEIGSNGKQVIVRQNPLVNCISFKCYKPLATPSDFDVSLSQHTPQRLVPWFVQVKKSAHHDVLDISMDVIYPFELLTLVSMACQRLPSMKMSTLATAYFFPGGGGVVLDGTAPRSIHCLLVLPSLSSYSFILEYHLWFRPLWNVCAA